MDMTADDLFAKLPNHVRVLGFDGGLLFRWSRTGVGYGELTLKTDAHGHLVANTEAMSDNFCLDVIKQAFLERKGGG